MTEPTRTQAEMGERARELLASTPHDARCSLLASECPVQCDCDRIIRAIERALQPPDLPDVGEIVERLRVLTNPDVPLWNRDRPYLAAAATLIERLSTQRAEGIEAAQRLQDHMEQNHGVSLSASEWDRAIAAAIRNLNTDTM